MKPVNAIVLGLGMSGEAAAALLRSQGAKVRIIDEAAGPEIRARAERLAQAGIDVALGRATENTFLFEGRNADICVVSPGIPQESMLISLALKLGIELTAEVDLGFRAATCPVIAVTGSNGKSTLVKLLADTLATLGIECMPCGNYGTPLSSAAVSGNMDMLVAEISTFQMEFARHFSPQTAVLLNLQPNHLDRHRDMQEYAALKARMFRQMPDNSIAVVNVEQKALIADANPRPRLITFGLDAGCDYCYEAGRVRGPNVQISIAGTFADNEVLGLTAAAALGVVEENGWAVAALEEAIRNFTPLEFRMQPLGELRGVSFVNNSKATTLSALEASLRMVSTPVRLVSGGKLKEKDLGLVKKMLVRKVARAYLYGQAGRQLSEAWSDSVETFVFEDLDSAVRRAYSDADEGDIVLLSPGCSSFDQYGGFAERGRDFNRIFEELRRLSQ